MTISSPFIVNFSEPNEFYGYTTKIGVHNYETAKTIANRYPGSTVTNNSNGRTVYVNPNPLPILE